MSEQTLIERLRGDNCVCRMAREAADEIEQNREEILVLRRALLESSSHQVSSCPTTVGVDVIHIIGGRCWHCRNQIMVAPELGCPTCGREQHLTRIYFGQPPSAGEKP